LKLPPPEPETPPTPTPKTPIKKVIVEETEIIDAQFLKINVKHVTGLLFT